MLHRLRSPFFAALLALPVLLVAGCDSDGDGDGDPTPGAAFRVMSQNLYLGGDLFVLVQEPNPQMIPVRVAELYGTIVASNPAERMAAIAAEIAAVNPALVGLQEVSTYYVQAPGDHLPGGPNTPATEVSFDFLELLLDALEDEGASYVVASRSDNSDVELPATTDGQTFFDVRYQDADVILARSDVATSDPEETVFQALLTIDVGGQPQTFTRSFQKVRATVGGSAFTFVNTHLEVGGAAAPFQQAQGNQLAAYVRSFSGDVILVGDLNSDAGGTGTTTYATITASNTGLVDAAGSGAGTPTCCQAADLRNDDSEHTTRIDLVLARGFDVLDFETVLDEATDKTAPSGLWPSDHAGVWAEVRDEDVNS